MVSQNGTVKSRVTCVAVGLFAMFVVSVVLLLFLTVLVEGGSLSIKNASYILLPMHILLSYIGCMICRSISKQRQALDVVFVVAGSIILQVALSVLVMNGSAVSLLWVALLEIAGGFIALVTGKKQIGAHKRKVYKKRYL